MERDTDHQTQATSYERSQRLLTLLQEISLDVAQAETINSAFAAVLTHVCHFMNWPLAHVYIWSEAANALVSSRIWYMADASTIVPFRELSEAAQFHRGEGTLGYVWETGEAITILDVHESPIIVREMPAEEEGVRAYFAFPVMVNDVVMAVLEFFSPESVPPDPDMTSVINHVSALLGLTWQREQTITQLKQSEAQLAEAQRTAHIGHWEWDVINNEVTWSPELYRIYGLTPGSFAATYETFLTFVHPDDQDFVQRKVSGARENGRPFDYFHRIIRPDHTIRVVHARGRPVYDHAGSIMKLIGTAQDMTELKETELKLAQSVRQLSALVEIGHALTETLELDKLVQLTVSQAQKIITNADWAAIHLLQPKTNHLDLAASAGLDLGLDEYRIEHGEGIAGQVIANGTVLNVADVQNDPRRLPVDLNTNAHSLLVAPVESRLRRIGTISVQCATPAIFTTDDERLLTLLGVQIGMAIENAHLFAVQRRAREKAERQRERMRHMARRVVQAQEVERARIARELHDESGQSLTSLKISLDLIRSALPESLSDIRDNLDEVLELTDKTMSNLRLLSHNLRPPGLDIYGLDATLAGLCQDFETHTHLKITYSGSELPELAELTSLSLYRFAQEAITNIVKHAKATEVQVTLTQDSDMIRLQVADNGCGFSPPELDEEAPQEGAGLAGMMERLEMVNGRMQIKSAPEQGCVITAMVPHIVAEEK